MITLLRNGEVYAPAHLGRRDVLLTDGKIGKVGPVDPRAVEALGIDHEIVDVGGCVVAPGFIDPHQHLLGGSGEMGCSTQPPEFFVDDIVRWGITTVVGCLGADTTMKTMAGLLAKVKGLKEEGLNAYAWTGGYDVPPVSIMESPREDIMFIEEVIGVGEVAISDTRALPSQARELARAAVHAHVGGSLARKAGLTHVHVGEGPRRLAPLREVLENFDVEPSWFYPTHVERGEALMREAIQLAGIGMAVDVDVVEGELAKWLRFYLDHGGDPSQLTVSTDAAISSPRSLYDELCKAIRGRVAPMEQLLAFVTSNPARILRLEEKGTVEKGKIGDLVVLDRETLEIRHVLSRGEWMVRDGAVCARPKFLKESSRTISLQGEEAT